MSVWKNRTHKKRRRKKQQKSRCSISCTNTCKLRLIIDPVARVHIKTTESNRRKEWALRCQEGISWWTNNNLHLFVYAFDDVKTFFIQNATPVTARQRIHSIPMLLYAFPCSTIVIDTVALYFSSHHNQENNIYRSDFNKLLAHWCLHFYPLNQHQLKTIPQVTRPFFRSSTRSK